MVLLTDIPAAAIGANIVETVPSRPLKSVKILSLIDNSIKRFLDCVGESIAMVSAETARNHLGLSSKHAFVKLLRNVKPRTIIEHSVTYRA